MRRRKGSIPTAAMILAFLAATLACLNVGLAQPHVVGDAPTQASHILLGSCPDADSKSGDIPVASRVAESPARMPVSMPEMEYVDVCGRNNDSKKLSRLIMGTDHLIQADWTGDGQRETTEKQAYEVLDEAAKLGINVFDTSPIYVGKVEEKLGNWLMSRRRKAAKDDFYYGKNLNPDRKLYALSKGGFPFDLYSAKKLESGSHSESLKGELVKHDVLNHNPQSSNDGSIPLSNVPAGTYASRLYGPKEQITRRVSEELGRSLSKLNDEVTIYLMHRDDGDFFRFNEIPRAKTPVKTIMEALSADELSKNYWALGWSNWVPSRVDESVDLARKNSTLARPTFNSAYFSLFEMSNRTIHAGGVQVTHQEMSDPNFEQGIKQNPYSPLGGFSILDKPEPRWENAMKAAKVKYDQGDPYWKNVYSSVFTAENKARYDRVVEFTGKFNRDHDTSYTVDQMLNAYALAHKRTDFLTIGPITVEQLRRTVGSLRLSRLLTQANLEYLYSGN